MVCVCVHLCMCGCVCVCQTKLSVFSGLLWDCFFCFSVFACSSVCVFYQQSFYMTMSSLHQSIFCRYEDDHPLQAPLMSIGTVPHHLSTG
jgi:hypothetical protein